jgi:hypothetical protein
MPLSRVEIPPGAQLGMRLFPFNVTFLTQLRPEATQAPDKAQALCARPAEVNSIAAPIANPIRN